MICLAACCLATTVFCALATAQSHEPPENNKETIALFNGKNLDGWYVFLRNGERNNDPKRVFTVQDGLLRISGEEFGCITTDEEYENYEIEVEYKTGTQMFAPREGRAFDCGVLLHSIGSDGAYGGVWMSSIECQIIDGGAGDLLVVAHDGSQVDNLRLSATVTPQSLVDHENGYYFAPEGVPVTVYKTSPRINRIGRDPNWQDTAHFRGENEIEKPAGQWNVLKCVAQGDTIIVYLNGKLVNRAFHVRPTKGRIQIQSEGAELFFKRIDLTPLPAK